MFGTELVDVGLLPAMGIALLSGILSFISPCVLPIVPPYLAYMSGISMAELQGRQGAEGRPGHARSALPAAIGFVLGLSTVFLLMGAAASAFGAFFLTNASTFSTLAGIIVMVFGAHFVGVYRIPLLDREMRVDAGDRGGSILGAYVLGLAFAFGWTPCLGPQLGAILSLATSQQDVAKGTFLLAIYALGLGIPFLLVAAFFPRLVGTMNWIKRHMERIEKAMGLLLWTIGLLMLTGGLSSFSYWLLEHFPGLATLG